MRTMRSGYVAPPASVGRLTKTVEQVEHTRQRRIARHSPASRRTSHPFTYYPAGRKIRRTIIRSGRRHIPCGDAMVADPMFGS